MNHQDVAANIGCCGKLCSFCEKRGYCEGCFSKDGKSSRRNQFEGCYQYNCAHHKGLKGCWECAQGPCDQDMFATAEGRYLKAFLSCIKEEGLHQFASYAFLRYIQGKMLEDYRDCENEAEVLALLKGKKQKTKG